MMFNSVSYLLKYLLGNIMSRFCHVVYLRFSILPMIQHSEVDLLYYAPMNDMIPLTTKFGKKNELISLVTFP